MVEPIRRPVYDRNDYIDIDRRYGRATNRRSNPIMTKRQKMINNPTLVDKSIYNKMVQHVPEGTKIASANRSPIRTDAIESAIPKSDPRHGMATEIHKDFNKYISDPRFAGADPDAILDTLYRGHLEKRREGIHKYSHNNRNSPFRILPGASNPIRELADQEAWDIDNPQGDYNSMATNFLIGAGGQLAITGLAAGGAALLGLATPAIAIGGAAVLARAALTAGALAIPGFLAFEKIENEIDNTQWAQENPGKALVAKLVVGSAGAIGVERSVANIAKRAGAAIMGEKAAQLAVVKNPSGDNLLNLSKWQTKKTKSLTEIQYKAEGAASKMMSSQMNKELALRDSVLRPKKRDNLINVLTKERNDKFKEVYNPLLKAKRKADKTIINAPVKRDYQNIIDDIENPGPPFSGPGSGGVGGKYSFRNLNKSNVSDLKGSNLIIPGSKYGGLNKATGEANKRLSRRSVNNFAEMTELKETGKAVSYGQANRMINSDKAIAKDMAKDTNILADVAAKSKTANASRANVSTVHQASGSKFKPLKSKADIKKAKQDDKVIENAHIYSALKDSERSIASKAGEPMVSDKPFSSNFKYKMGDTIQSADGTKKYAITGVGKKNGVFYYKYLRRSTGKTGTLKASVVDKAYLKDASEVPFEVGQEVGLKPRDLKVVDEPTELITKPIRDFHKNLLERVRETGKRIDERITMFAKNGGYGFASGVKVKSKKTGKMYNIYHSWNGQKDVPMYRAKGVNGEVTNLFADKADDGFELVKPLGIAKLEDKLKYKTTPVTEVTSAENIYLDKLKSLRALLETPSKSKDPKISKQYVKDVKALMKETGIKGKNSNDTLVKIEKELFKLEPAGAPILSKIDKKVGQDLYGSPEMSINDILTRMPKAESPEFSTWARVLSHEERNKLTDKVLQDVHNEIPGSRKILDKLDAVSRQVSRDSQKQIPKIVKNEFPDLSKGTKNITAQLEEDIVARELHVDKIIKAQEKKLREKLGAVDVEKLDAMGEHERINLFTKALNFDTDTLKSMIPLLLGVGGVVTLMDGIAPSEVEASTLTVLGGAAKSIFGTKVGLPATKKLLQETESGLVNKLFKSLESQQRIATVPLDKATAILDTNIMKVKIQAAVPTDIKTNKKMLWFLEDLVCPLTVDNHYLGRTLASSKNTVAGPTVQYAALDTSIRNNIKHTSKIFTQIMDKWGIKAEAENVAKRMEPFRAKFDEAMYERSVHQVYARDYKISLAKMYKDLGRLNKKKDIILSKDKKALNTEKINDQIAAIELFEARQAGIQKRVTDTDIMFKEYTREWEITTKALAKDYPSTRVYLASGDYNNLARYPWLKSMMTKNELSAVNDLKVFNEHYGLRLLEGGHKVITTRPFIHQAIHPNTNLKNVENKLQKTYGAAFKQSPAMTKFHSRNTEKLPMMPEIGYAMQKYIPDAELRLGSSHFWYGPKGDGVGGWSTFANSNVVQGIDGLRGFFDNFKKAMLPIEKSGIDKFAERAYAFEVMRLLSFSASVPFKHSMKLIGDLRVFGKDGILAVPEASRTYYRNLGRKAGLNLPKGQYDEAVDQWTNTGNMVNTLTDMNVTTSTTDEIFSPQLFKRIGQYYDKGISKVNQVGGAPTAFIEGFDRSLSVIASLKMAAKQGMSADHAMYATFDTILRTNFLSGAMNPRWLRDPKIRFFLMFQGTPFKLVEQKLITVAGAARNISGAGKELYKQMMRDVVEGEQRFQGSLIMEALTKEKDIFGTSITRQFMRQAVATGVALGAGAGVLGIDLTDHFLHLPFAKMKPSSDAPVPQSSPIPTAVYKTLMNRGEEDADPWLTSFYNEWFSRKGPWPINFLKAARLTRGDIPEIYEQSRLKYLFATPAAGHKRGYK